MKIVLLLGLLVAAVIAKPQIQFGEEGEDAKPSTAVEIEPISNPNVESTDTNNELVQTRLGLLAGYLSKLLF